MRKWRQQHQHERMAWHLKINNQRRNVGEKMWLSREMKALSAYRHHQ
jgi:hypothetical protein